MKHHLNLFGFHLPHRPHLSHGHGHKKEEPVPPKGCMAIRVSPRGEEQRKFIVPVEYLNHPLFVQLLKESEEEYGFEQQGAITLPCRVEDFQHVQDAIDRESGAVADDDRHHRRRRHHLDVAGCFRA